MTGNSINLFFRARLSVVGMAPCFVALPNRGEIAVSKALVLPTRSLTIKMRAWTTVMNVQCVTRRLSTGTGTTVGGSDGEQVSP